MNVTAAPQPGELVSVRSRQFVVSDVVESRLDQDVLRDATTKAQHLVRLSSVDDDAYGEELSVIWEIEPGAEVIENALLPAPDAFDHPKRLDAFLDAVRWGAVESADSKALQSPFRSGIKIEDYQLDPVARAIEMPRVNLLIADDVGLGKTIEAGLVAQELILRHKARRILVVCPASLQIKWRDEMHEKFGLDFTIVNTELMRELRRKRGIRVNPWNHFPRLITSIDYLKRARPLQRFRECLPSRGEPAYPRRFDLMILDEAHNVAPSGGGNYATDSQRTHAIRTLTPHFEHKLFLTATPHNGYKESFSALLELLDDQRFAREVEPDPAQLEAVMVHRLKSELKNWDGSDRFKARQIVPIELDHSADERAAHSKLREYGDLLRKSTDAEGRRSVATDFVLKLLKKRLFSSPAAFLHTLEQHERTLRGLNRSKRTKTPNTSVLERRFEEIDSTDYFDDDEYEEALYEGLDTAGSVFESLGEDERRLLRELKDWATQSSARADAKADELLSWLKATCRPDGEWNDERVIVFTEYRTTQKWLQGLFARDGLASEDRLGVIYGGMDGDDREDLKAAFQASPDSAPIRILLATDSASEGIDLQNHCHRLLHYDIPWNPNRLEQRNGRIDRHGQKFTPEIIHFASRGWDKAAADRDLKAGDLDGDLEFLAHIVRKVDQIREDLGKVGPVIASQIEAAMLGNRTTLDTTTAERDAKPIREQLRFRKDLTERIAQLHDQLSESKRELHVSPENVQSVVEIGLELAGQPPLRVVSETSEGQEGRVFHMPQLVGTWAGCSEGLAHPHTGEIRPITFDHAAAEDRDDVVLVHLGHRLVQMAQRLLRAEVWTSGDRSKLARVTARVVPEEALNGPAVIVHARILVLGGNDYRLHEEIITVGGTLESGRFRRLNVGQTNAAIEAATDQPVSGKLHESFRELWPKVEKSVRDGLEARMKERAKGLERKIADRCKKDVDRMRAVMTELAQSIRAQLEAQAPDQLELWEDEEIEQRERNRESLEARLKAIPEEIEREASEITRRYADPTPRVFPVSTTFLVPESFSR